MSASHHVHATLDAIVVGGGFYGVIIALYLVRERGLRRVCVLEREADLMRRASYGNQARVHNGYHYPRSFTTAYRSRINLPRFVSDFPDAVVCDFTKLYAIARRNSHVSARQFVRFCRSIGASLAVADKGCKRLFESRLIEEVFVVTEYAFDAEGIAAWARAALASEDIELWTCAEAISIDAVDGSLAVAVTGTDTAQASAVLTAPFVFNCTYSGLNRLRGAFPGTRTQLKHELAELALFEPPRELAALGITLMDGPFFSVLPFPARGLHSLSHVRYTPHCHWDDSPDIDPYSLHLHSARESRVDRMLRDATRYLPALRYAHPVDSLFEVKTVLTKNECDDGRPILFEKCSSLPGCYTILGGKLDNIYDVLEKLDLEPLEVPRAC